MDVAHRDQIINLLRSEIRKTQAGVLEQLKDIGEIQQENDFLTGVKVDYQRYHAHIVNQKRREREHLLILVDYLEKALMEAGMTEAMERQARFEQNRILKALDDLKYQMDEIISQDNSDESNADE